MPLDLNRHILYKLNDSLENPKELNDWLQADPENQKVYDLSELIWNESENLSEYKSVDENEAWSEFEGLIRGKSDKDQEVQSKAVVRRMHFFRFAEIAVAASLAFAIFFFMTKEEPVIPDWYIAETQENQDTISLPDGSIAYMAENSTLLYPRTFERKEKRSVYLKGQSTFDVATIDTMQFGVESYEVGIDVYGTVFEVSGLPGVAEVENKEGQIRFLELENPDNFIDMNPGDKIRFEGGVFENLNEIPGDEFVPGVLFEELLSRFDGLLAPGAGFRPQNLDTIRVDLNQTLTGVLRQLDTTAHIRYVKTPWCSECYELLELGPKKE